jgi:hypothetical protein
MTKKEQFFFWWRLATTKKLGTHNILMEYEQSVRWQFVEKKNFGQTTIFKKNMRSNDLSVKWQFFLKKLFVKGWFGHLTIFWKKKSVIWPFGKMNFRSDGAWLNGDAVKWNFGLTVFGQMVFWSNGVRSKKFGKMTFR